MTGAELKLMREYKNMERSHEDFLMTDINEAVSKLIDERGFQKYTEVQKMCKEFEGFINKITDYTYIEIHVKEIKEQVDIFYEDADKYTNYFNNADGIMSEVIGLIKDRIEPKMEEMEALQYSCMKIGYSKTSYNIQFGIKKLRETMITLLKNIVLSSTREYKKLIMEELANTEDKYINRVKQFIPCSNENIESVHRKPKKILDCYDMDLILREQKYIPIRQKGSHLIYKKGNARPIPVPQHKSLNKELGYGIQREILKNE